MISIQQIVNSPFNSNTYIIFGQVDDVIAIIDPGEVKTEYLLNILSQKVKSDFINVILTHEHFDHIAGLLKLCVSHKIKLYASKKCIESLNDPQKNLSQFLDFQIINQIKPYKIYPVVDSEKIIINKLEFSFYTTPGHSEGSVCIGLGKYIFTGDTLLESVKTITNLPGGSKHDFHNSKIKLLSILNKYELVYPGHGAAYKIKN